MGTRQEVVQGPREIFSVEGPLLRRTLLGHMSADPSASGWQAGAVRDPDWGSHTGLSECARGLAGYSNATAGHLETR